MDSETVEGTGWREAGRGASWPKAMRSGMTNGGGDPKSRRRRRGRRPFSEAEWAPIQSGYVERIAPFAWKPGGRS